MLKDLKIFKYLGFVVWFTFGVYCYGLEQNCQRVVMFDVGQGDSILIQRGSYEILIDSGGDDSIVYKLGEYMRWSDRLVDVVVITHMHTDHYGGIRYVLERYDVGLFVISKNCGDLCDLFRGYNYVEVEQGLSMGYMDIGMEVLWPVAGYSDSNLNNDSIVLLVNYINKRFLLMGDAEIEVEEYILDSYMSYITDIDILKAGHHCSKTASSYDFLEVTNPTMSICSCGEGNRFGHPHRETLEMFDILVLDYYITWEEGDYVVE